MNKKGSEMTIGTIIAITLGVALLVFLIFGFSRGWGNLWGTVSEIGGGDSNVDDVARGCEIACAQNNVYDYCEKTRTLKFGKDSDEDPNPLTGKTCEELAEANKISVTCSIC